MRVCIVQPSLNTASETFLRTHAEGVPGVVGIVHGQGGQIAINGNSILSQQPWMRRVRRVVDQVARVGFHRKRSWSTDSSYRRAFQRLRPDVILAEYGPTGVDLLDTVDRLGLPLVVHFHGYDASRRDVLSSLSAAYAKMFRQATAVIAVSRAMRRQLMQLGCPEDKLLYNPCGVDCRRFCGAEPSASLPRFLAVGRLVEKKAPHLTILAFARVLKHAPESRLLIGGAGSLLGICRDITAGLRIEHAVTFLGEVTHCQVQEEMTRARGFVQHSVEAADGDCEGTPVAILEAGACGLPVVSTRHAGIPDVVLEGKTGLLVEERDVDGMAAHMLRLAKDASYAGHLGKQAAQHIRSRYTSQHSLTRLTRILHAAAERRPIGSVREEIDAELSCQNETHPLGPESEAGPNDRIAIACTANAGRQ